MRHRYQQRHARSPSPTRSRRERTRVHSALGWHHGWSDLAAAQRPPHDGPGTDGLPEQVRAVVELLTNAAAAMPLPAIEASFKGKGPWKRGLPRILKTLEALGRARQERDGWRG